MSAQNTAMKKVVAECIGTAFLLMAVVGSGIMAETLSGSNVSLALLENTDRHGRGTGGADSYFRSCLRCALQSCSNSGHATQGGVPWKLVPAYIAAQCLGAMAGVYAAHAMFGQGLVQTSTHVRLGGAQIFSEFIATFGLLAVIWGCSRARLAAVPFAVGAHHGSILVHGINFIRESRCH
jgi:glycerol uptake facilitator-like aquaporin